MSIWFLSMWGEIIIKDIIDRWKQVYKENEEITKLEMKEFIKNLIEQIDNGKSEHTIANIDPIELLIDISIYNKRPELLCHRKTRDLLKKEIKNISAKELQSRFLIVANKKQVNRSFRNKNKGTQINENLFSSSRSVHTYISIFVQDQIKLGQTLYQGLIPEKSLNSDFLKKFPIPINFQTGDPDDISALLLMPIPEIKQIKREYEFATSTNLSMKEGLRLARIIIDHSRDQKTDFESLFLRMSSISDDEFREVLQKVKGDDWYEKNYLKSPSLSKVKLIFNQIITSVPVSIRKSLYFKQAHSNLSDSLKGSLDKSEINTFDKLLTNKKLLNSLLLTDEEKEKEKFKRFLEYAKLAKVSLSYNLNTRLIKDKLSSATRIAKTDKSRFLDKYHKYYPKAGLDDIHSIAVSLNSSYVIIAAAAHIKSRKNRYHRVIADRHKTAEAKM